jgi:hypothetical protein
MRRRSPGDGSTTAHLRAKKRRSVTTLLQIGDDYTDPEAIAKVCPVAESPGRPGHGGIVVKFVAGNPGHL